MGRGAASASDDCLDQVCEADWSPDCVITVNR